MLCFLPEVKLPVFLMLGDRGFRAPDILPQSFDPVGDLHTFQQLIGRELLGFLNLGFLLDLLTLGPSVDLVP